MQLDKVWLNVVLFDVCVVVLSCDLVPAISVNVNVPYITQVI